MNAADAMRIGFCGTGFLGTPMVRRLLAAGREVVVWNRTPEKCRGLAADGAVLAGSPAELASACDVVLLCLYDADAVESVVFGPHGVAQSPRTRWLVDHSSIAPARTRAFARRFAQGRGAHWIDAPVSGGVPGAQAGTLAVMAGGDADAIAAVAPVLAAYAARTTRMGPCGAGQIAKLCNQVIVATGVAAVAEAIALAERSGIDAARLLDAFGGGLADSRLLQIFGARMLDPSPAKSGLIATMLKDLDAVVSLGADNTAALPLTLATRALMRQALLHVENDPDLWQVVELYRGRTAPGDPETGERSDAH